ncbi:MAG TPA: aminotransferase class V-fold PLP-dependent enzyme [Streptosporangiaceae bacterium]|jgi:cysteine desulfurase/selenocysteine lyase|nr:aminotransferase class V-fold PLP-dependent enzyme [Streptosporangiaceae bacterium]
MNDDLDVRAIRRHFGFPATGRVLADNAAGTPLPRELTGLYRSLAPRCGSMPHGRAAAAEMTARYEESLGTIAAFIGAPGPACLALYRSTTEAINAVMYALLTEFRDGDNVVLTMLEHDSGYVPWYAMCREILPRFGRRVDYRLARFDPATGELDLAHLASLIDERTKLVCCTGGSGFLGTRPPLATIQGLAGASGYVQPGGERRSYLLVDAAQLLPGAYTDVTALDADFLAFSCDAMLTPPGTAVLYGREPVLRSLLPFQYGGGMVAEGQVLPGHVEYLALPGSYRAEPPGVLGAIVSAEALRLLLDLALSPGRPVYFGTGRPVTRATVWAAMDRVERWTQRLTARALDGLAAVPGITVYGPRHAARRTPLVAFRLAGRDPVSVAAELDRAGIESGAGGHCSSLAHHALGLHPPASVRFSFCLYNTPAEVDRAVAAVAAIAAGPPAGRRQRRSRPTVPALFRPHPPAPAGSPPAAPAGGVRGPRRGSH